MTVLTEAQQAALDLVHGGRLACDDLPTRQGRDPLGSPIPGISTYKQLEKLGLVIFTEALEMEMGEGEDPFFFTAYLELSPKGEAARKQARLDPEGVFDE